MGIRVPLPSASGLGPALVLQNWEMRIRFGCLARDPPERVRGFWMSHAARPSTLGII